VRLATRSAIGLLTLGTLSFALGATWEVQKDGLRPVPALASPVTDLTGTLSAAQREALDAKLRDWEARTTNQLAVLIVPTTAPESIEDYSIRVAEAWKIGQKGKDNGAIFLIAKDDKRMRIEVGYGFEGVLTDATSRRIIAETVAPYFKQGRFAEGIDAGVERIIAVADEGRPLPPVGNPARKARRGPDFGTLLVILLVAVPVVGAILRSMFGTLGGSVIGAGIVGAAAWFVAASLLIAGVATVIAFLIILFSSFGGRGGWIPMGGGWGGGGGFGGGGFSGGGGGFGGGGASGGWD
jgi:uncharacterized protein